MPLCFALFVTALLSGRAWVPNGFASAFSTGIGQLWLSSQPRSTFDERLIRHLPLVHLGLAVGFGVSFAALVVSITKGDKPIKRAAPWLLGALVFAGLVAYFSSSAGGGGSMIQWIAKTFGVSHPFAEAATYVVRKTIHFSFYAGTAIVMGRAAFRGGEAPKPAIAIALAYALLLATFDETRQSGFADRSGSPIDVALDLTGSLTGIALTFRRKPARRAQKGS